MIPAPIDNEERDSETAAFLAAVDEGRAAIMRGEVVSHEIVGLWLDAVARGERPPLPDIPGGKRSGN